MQFCLFSLKMFPDVKLIKKCINTFGNTNAIYLIIDVEHTCQAMSLRFWGVISNINVPSRSILQLGKVIIVIIILIIITTIIFTHLAPRSIHFIICNVRDYVCTYVPSVDDRNRDSWRLLVEERIANIEKLRTPFFWSVSMIFCV